MLTVELKVEGILGIIYCFVSGGEADHLCATMKEKVVAGPVAG